IEPGDLVRPAVARRKHEHRHLPAFLAPAVEHREPIDLRQSEIEDHRVIAFGRSEIMAVLPVGREIDRIARAFERRAQLAPEIGLVFDDQNAHRCSPELFIFAPSTRGAARGCLSGTTGRRRGKVNPWRPGYQGCDLRTIRPVWGSTSTQMTRPF